MQEYTTEEAATILRVSRRAIQKWIHAGYFPSAYKINPDGATSPYRIPASDIEAFDRRRREQQTID
jgi:excisionase family DNA binding protein